MNMILPDPCAERGHAQDRATHKPTFGPFTEEDTREVLARLAHVEDPGRTTFLPDCSDLIEAWRAGRRPEPMTEARYRAPSPKAREEPQSKNPHITVVRRRTRRTTEPRHEHVRV